MTTTTADQDRKSREKAFHDKTFADETRSTALKFYSVVESSWRCYEAILQRLCPGKHVLEYGCGPGSYSFFMAERGAHVTGIDISVTAIELANRRAASQSRCGTAAFFVMDAECLGFPDGSFDVVCGRAILHHLDMERSLSEIVRVLKENGRAVFVEPLGHNPFINLYRRRTPKLRTVDEHPLLTSDLATIKAKFQNVTFRYFHLCSLASVPLRGVPGYKGILRLLAAVDQALFAVCPFMRKYAWTVVMDISTPLRDSQADEPASAVV